MLSALRRPSRTVASSEAGLAVRVFQYSKTGQRGHGVSRMSGKGSNGQGRSVCERDGRSREFFKFILLSRNGCGTCPFHGPSTSGIKEILKMKPTFHSLFGRQCDKGFRQCSPGGVVSSG